MTKELYINIITAALFSLIKLSDKEITKLIGFPVDRSYIEWCIENPIWQDKTIDDLITLFEKYNPVDEKEMT